MDEETEYYKKIMVKHAFEQAEKNIHIKIKP
jgi:hypothetical protein